MPLTATGHRRHAEWCMCPEPDFAVSHHERVDAFAELRRLFSTL